jgi:tetratricopeptide (TPR) repeat protein
MINALFDVLGTCYQAGDFAQAEMIARSILRAIPDDTVSLQFLGLVYHRTRRFADARAVFAATSSAVAPPPADTAAPGATALASAQCLPAASGEGSALADAWYELGLLLFRRRHFPPAMRALQAAISARPNFHAAQQAIHRVARVARCRQKVGANLRRQQT